MTTTATTETAFARSVKIWPTGALLKKGFLKFETALLFSSAGWLGRLPVCLKMAASDAGEVRNLTRSAAAAAFFD